MLQGVNWSLAKVRRKLHPVPLSLKSFVSVHGQIIKLDSVLGAREGENKKITVSHCTLPPSLGHLVPVDVEMQPRRPPGVTEKPPECKGCTLEILVRASCGYLGAGEVCAHF